MVGIIDTVERRRRKVGRHFNKSCIDVRFSIYPRRSIMVAAIARTIHSVQVRTVGTVLLKVAKLTRDSIIYTGRLQALGVVLVLSENLDDEDSDAPHIKTMRLICDLPINGMMPAVMGTVIPALSASSRKR